MSSQASTASSATSEKISAASNVASSASFPILEGVGNEVLQIALGSLIATIMVLLAIYFMQRRSREYEIHPDMRESIMETRAVISGTEAVGEDGVPNRPCHRSFRGNDVTCPICLGDKQLSVETNCGHIFCGQCILTYWHHSNWLGAVICPVCRTEVNILLQNFPSSQTQQGVTSEDQASVVSSVAMYNRRFSGRSVPFLDQLRDLPMLMRHMFAEFFSLNGLVLMFRIRFVGCCIMALIYIISPFDIIPEAAFVRAQGVIIASIFLYFLRYVVTGILGLVDDVLIVLLIAVYSSVTYRRYITSQAMEDE